MADTHELILDPWAGLSHKALLRQANAGLNPTWVGPDHQRRLNAYKILAALRANCARYLLPEVSIDSGTPVPTNRSIRREYGDADLFVKQVRAAVLGDGVTWLVDGADDELPDEEIDEGDELRAAEQRGRGQDDTLDPEKERRRILDARAWQARYDEWAAAERFRSKMFDVEDRAVGLGDGVYHVAWSERRKRVVITSYDPGFYFPVLDEAAADEGWPLRVHLAWEFNRVDPDGVRRRYVRRITHELVEVPPYTPRYFNGGQPATRTCLLTDAEWRIDNLHGNDVDALSLDRATFKVGEDGVPLDRYDLLIDFIPIVHIPNTPSEQEHYGAATLTVAAQAFDDLHATDTDLRVGAGLLGIPPIVVEGPPPADYDPLVGHVYGPGQVFYNAEGMSLMDTSRALDSLLAYSDHLWKRICTVLRVPEEVVGKVNASEVPSGFALALAFSPFRSLIDEMRLAREDKYRLLFKMVGRLHQHGGVWPNEDLPAVELRFGSYLPADLQGLADLIRKLIPDVDKAVLSTRTAVRLLKGAGLEVDSVNEEVAEIRAEDHAGAAARADALRSDKAAAEWLGVELPDDSGTDTQQVEPARLGQPPSLPARPRPEQPRE